MEAVHLLLFHVYRTTIFKIFFFFFFCFLLFLEVLFFTVPISLIPFRLPDPGDGYWFPKMENPISCSLFPKGLDCEG